MSTSHESLTQFQNRTLDTVASSQAAAVSTFVAWSRATASLMPQGARPSELPGSQAFSALADNVGRPDDVVDFAYDWAGQLLTMHRQLAHSVVTASSTLLGIAIPDTIPLTPLAGSLVKFVDELVEAPDAAPVELTSSPADVVTVSTAVPVTESAPATMAAPARKAAAATKTAPKATPAKATAKTPTAKKATAKTPTAKKAASMTRTAKKATAKKAASKTPTAGR